MVRKMFLSDTCVDHYILLLKYLSNHMHFVINVYKRFSKTNSTDSRQRVPLIIGCLTRFFNKVLFRTTGATNGSWS